MSGLEVAGLVLSYVSSIVTLSSLIRRRERGSKTSSKLLQEAEECAERLETAVEEVLKQEYIETETLTHLQELSQELPGIRDSLSESKNTRSLRNTIATLHDMEQRLIKIIAKEHVTPGFGSDSKGDFSASAVDLPTITIAPQYFNTRQLSQAALHLIYQPDHTPVSNIVFVHGLYGNAESTWTSSAENCIFWPHHFLAKDKDISKSAIWVYSYNSEIDKYKRSTEPLRKVFRRIAYDLRLSVETQTRGPLIWVAHSLGGHLVKTALTLPGHPKESEWNEDADTTNLIASRTRGIIFMGTPHAGSSQGIGVARFTTILSVFSRQLTMRRSTSEDLELQFDSDINRTTLDFTMLMDRKGFPIVSLFESQPMLTNFGPRMIVDEFARLNHPSETTGILEGNHLTMCKFQTGEERGYASVLRAIASLQQNISFGTLNLVTSHQPASPVPSKTASASDADTVDTETLYTRLRLKFDAPVSRWNSIKLRSYEDGSWFPNSEAFEKWFEGSKRAPLLIQGPAGCGKTTIAECVLESLRHYAIRQHLSRSICQIHLFFRSDRIVYQSPIAILVALIAQVIDRDSSLVRHFRRLPPRFENMNVATQAHLKGTLRQMLEDPCWKEIYIVVDALNECHESFVQSSFDIIAWILEIPKMHAIFTNSTGNNSSEALLALENPSKDADLASVLKAALWRNKEDCDVVDLRKYQPWINRLDTYISNRLSLKKVKRFDKMDTITSLPTGYRYRLKTALMVIPHLSFSVVNIVLQDIQDMTSLYQELPPKFWFDEKVSQLVAATMMYNALIKVARALPNICVRILSLLCCAQEPLRVPECCSLWEHGLSLNLESPDCNLRPEQLYNMVTSGNMPMLVTVGGNGLHLSSDMVRQAINRQMKQSRASETLSTEDTGSSHLFEDYERFNCRIARSCLLILRQNTQSPGESYARKHLTSHLLQAGASARELDFLVKEYYQQRTSPAVDSIREPDRARESRVFRGLVEDSLSVNLGSIFSDVAEGIEFPDLGDIDAALQDPPSQETLVEMQKINSRSRFNRDKQEQKSLKLETILAIQKHDIETLKAKINNQDFSLDDRMGFLRLALDISIIEIVEIVLQHFQQKNLVPDHQGRELLTRAVRYQKRDFVTSMLRYRHLFDVNSALIAAVEISNIHLCEDLLKYGADVKVRSKSNETVLHIATATNSASLISALLKWNAEVNAVDAKSRTALHLAAVRGYTEVARVLLKNSVSLTARDQFGRSPFFAACTYGHRDTAQLLWFSGGNLREKDAHGRCLLHAAASSGHQEVLGMLLEAGIEVEPKDQIGITPLHEAAEQGWTLIVDELLQLGADIETKCLGGASSLHFACTATNAPEAVVRLLLEKGADPRARDVLGRTPLLLAVHFSTVRVVQILVELDKDTLNDADNQGYGVYEYLHATDPIGSHSRRLTSKELSKRGPREAAHKEKRDYLTSKVPNFDMRRGTSNWQVTSIRAMAEEERTRTNS